MLDFELPPCNDLQHPDEAAGPEESMGRIARLLYNVVYVYRDP